MEHGNMSAAAIEQRHELEPRLNAFRPDLADARLQGKVDAKKYVEGIPALVTLATACVHREPDSTTPVDTQVLFGEEVTIYERSKGWAWVQLKRDSYVGFVHDSAFTPLPDLSHGGTSHSQGGTSASKSARSKTGLAITSPTHRVSAVGTFIFPQSDIKSPPTTDLPMNAMLRVTGTFEKFLKLQGGGFVVSRHTAALDQPALDFVEIAERFIGTPYLWGGRTRRGIDCSGLVQLCLEAAGANAPRDSDMQQSALGQDVLVPADLEGLQRGDLVFWPGHVGIMTDGIFLLHANAHHMAVAMEPLHDVQQRAAKTGGNISAIKRLGE